MTENDIAKEVVDAAFAIHSKLGPGLLESVYEILLADELIRRGLSVQQQVPIQIEYNGREFPEAFRDDLIVNELVIIELKSVEEVRPVYKKQLLTYLRLTKLKLGLLINFGENLIKDGITRVANGM
ncbi:GxxExxY protein [Pontiellaceae bacterium B1224]|nr:GxxExxY protein [Pontiellaceae bacterium B1224]